MDATLDTSGRIAVEGRGSTFVVHAAYDGASVRRLVGDLLPGDHFRYDAADWAVMQMTEHDVEASRRGCGEMRRFAVATIVNVEATDDHRPTSGASRPWVEFPSPTFASRDLDDLIASLQALRARRRTRST